MNFKRLLSVLLLLLAFGLATPAVAQTIGGRKKEHRNQRSSRGSIFHRKSSGGHADHFASNKRNQGFFGRIFHPKKDGGAWVYKPTRPGVKQNKEQRFLFSRARTKQKQYRDGLLAKQNKRRSGTRVRGNESFSHKKH